MTGDTSREAHVFLFADLESSTQLWQRFPGAMKAAMERHDTILREAVEQWGGQTALMWAASRKQPGMVKLLVSKGADVNARGVVRNWARKVTAEGRPKDMNRGGFTPMLYAAREGCAECVRERRTATA